MSSFEWNKVFGAVLTALIVAMVAGILASKIVAPTELAKPVFVVPGMDSAVTATASAPAAPKLEPIGPLLAKADPKKGEKIAQVCTTCHTFNKGGRTGVGPNLWGVAQEKIATVPGYDFSAALKAHTGEKWDPEKLNKWLFNPQADFKGTKMTFAGLPSANDRADVIAFLESLK
jgi:cytochrome c